MQIVLRNTSIGESVNRRSSRSLNLKRVTQNSPKGIHISIEQYRAYTNPRLLKRAFATFARTNRPHSSAWAGMVLLTSSAVSFILTTGVICTFTFLLFLSGYVLQQQTVRSLQEALRQPPQRYGPVPTLPAQFAESENDTVEEVVQQVIVEGGSTMLLAHATLAQQAEAETTDFPQLEVHGTGQPSSIEATTYIEEGTTDTESTSQQPSSNNQQPLSSSTKSTAYIFTLDHPSSLCSALLFARQQRQSTAPSPLPALIFLYPSTWESNPTPLHISALTFMRDIQAEYSIIYHPVQITSAWSNLGVQAHLLGEVQRVQWDFDRVLYLKTPGMATDLIALENALQKSNVKKSWTSLTAAVGTDPELLMYTREKGLLMPRGDMRRLTASAATKHSDHHVGEMDVEAMVRQTAYVVFDEEELEHRRMEKEWYGGIFERFERGRQEICKGRSLLRGEEDKFELRRKM